jgi:predicted nucleotidyltransferase
MAARRGLKTVALTHEDTLAPKAIAQGTVELAKKRGLSVVLVEAYPKGTTDLSAVLTKVRAANPDVLAAATYFDDAVALTHRYFLSVAITRQMKALNVNPKMTGPTVGVDLPKFYEVMGRDAEFVYGTSTSTRRAGSRACCRSSAHMVGLSTGDALVDGVFFIGRDARARHYNRRMPAERRMPEDLADRIDGLARAWSGDPDLAAIYLFGSRAGGRGGPRSDVDLAVVLREELDAAVRWRKRLTLLSDACQRLGTDAVDLVVLEDAPVPLGHRVLKWGRLLGDPLPQRRADVAERILRRYLDEAYLRRVLDAGLAERLREKRFAR